MISISHPLENGNVRHPTNGLPKSAAAHRFLLLALLVVGCGGPTTVTPSPTVAVVEPSERTDAEKAALVREGIEIVYGTDPQPDWYPDLRRVDGTIDLAVDGTSLFVVATSAELADEMCRDIAFIPYDDDAELIGFRHVHVQLGPDIVADCDIRE